jgi:hypothetical protein
MIMLENILSKNTTSKLEILKSIFFKFRIEFYCSLIHDLKSIISHICLENITLTYYCENKFVKYRVHYEKSLVL